MSPFVIWCLENHFPAVKNIITFIFSAEILWQFTREDRQKAKLLHFFVNYVIKVPSLIAGTILEFYEIIVAFLKKLYEFMWDCIWYGYNDESKILLAAWMESVIIKIWFTLGRQVAWLILHLIVKSSASVDATFTIWYIVLMTGLSWLWMCNIDVTIWFLMLASITTTTERGSNDAWMVILSRHHK